MFPLPSQPFPSEHVALLCASGTMFKTQPPPRPYSPVGGKTNTHRWTWHIRSAGKRASALKKTERREGNVGLREQERASCG